MSFLEESKIYTKVELKSYEPLGLRTTFGVGGTAKYYAEPQNLESIIRLIDTAKSYGIDYFILGNGSKLLVSDSGYNGLAISLKNLSKITVKEDTLYVGGGASLKETLKVCENENLGGLEFLYGIPGTVGGAVNMNAGAFSENLSSVLTSVIAYENGKIISLNKSDCEFTYRASRFTKTKGVILEAEFNLYKSYNVKEKCKYYKLKRQCAQPGGKSCGSIFKNPEGLSAGFLIEKAGLKGKTIGGATVSEKHANFIINSKNATASDVKSLIELIKETIFDLYSIKLEEEVIYIGEFKIDTYGRLSHSYDLQPR